MARLVGDPIGEIIDTVERRVERTKGVLASRLEETVRANIASGFRLGQYSTNPGWFSLSPTGRRISGALLAYARTNKRGLKRPQDRTLRGAGYFGGGYAQYRSIYTGKARAPVDLEFTGKMMRALKGIEGRSIKRGTAIARITFRRDNRGYGIGNWRIAEEQIARSRRLGYDSPFSPSRDQAIKIFKDAFNTTFR